MFARVWVLLTHDKLSHWAPADKTGPYNVPDKETTRDVLRTRIDILVHGLRADAGSLPPQRHNEKGLYSTLRLYFDSKHRMLQIIPLKLLQV
jgi:hypothetical protein